MIWVTVSHKYSSSGLHKKVNNFFFFFFFTFPSWENQTLYWEKGFLFQIGNGAEISAPRDGSKYPIFDLINN